MDNKTSKDVVAKPKLHAKTEARLKAQQERAATRRSDWAKFILAAVLVAAGVYGFYALAAQLPVYVRALFPVAGVVAAILIVFRWSSAGRGLSAYVKDSTAELRKVVWPERAETARMTLFVLAFVSVLALFIWGADSLISWLFFDVLMKRG